MKLWLRAMKTVLSETLLICFAGWMLFVLALVFISPDNTIWMGLHGRVDQVLVYAEMGFCIFVVWWAIKEIRCKLHTD